MGRYTSTQEISFDIERESRGISANGTLTISVYTGNEWLVADTITDSTVRYFTKALRLKFEISPGGFYYIEEGEDR